MTEWSREKSRNPVSSIGLYCTDNVNVEHLGLVRPLAFMSIVTGNLKSNLKEIIYVRVLTIYSGAPATQRAAKQSTITIGTGLSLHPCIEIETCATLFFPWPTWLATYVTGVCAQH